MTNDNVNKLLDSIKAKFAAKLLNKPMWYTSDIVRLYTACVIEAITECINAGDNNG